MAAAASLQNHAHSGGESGCCAWQHADGTSSEQKDFDALSCLSPAVDCDATSCRFSIVTGRKKKKRKKNN
jgi:hypothetical protein